MRQQPATHETKVIGGKPLSQIDAALRLQTFEQATTLGSLHFVTHSLGSTPSHCSSQVVRPSSTQAVSDIDYEELLEEMEKLDIADLLLIHSRAAVR